MRRRSARRRAEAPMRPLAGQAVIEHQAGAPGPDGDGGDRGQGQVGGHLHFEVQDPGLAEAGQLVGLRGGKPRGRPGLAGVKIGGGAGEAQVMPHF